jgi:predicted acyl esterase
MQIIDLDGNSHNWLLTGNMAYATNTNKSDLHIKARDLLTQEFPTLQILEEVAMPLKKGVTLYMDFYLPLKKICCEVHGEQHYRFIKFYHSSLLSFYRSQKRDREKQEWCEQNNIRYVVFPFDNSSEEWRKILNEY